MEKKKLLLVAVSVGIFLIIVIGLSILIFLPRNKESVASSRGVSKGTNTANSRPDSSTPQEMERTAPATVDAVDMLRNREAIQGLQPLPDPATSMTEELDRNNGSNLVIEIQRPSAVAVPNTEPTGRSNQNVAPIQPARPAVTQTPPPSRDIPLTTTSTARPSNSTPTPGVSKPVTSDAPKPPVQSSRPRNDYWIQTGAFSTQVKAQDVKDILASKGITAIIENRDVNGQNLFRVRVGPYTSENEADYWLVHIKNIGFEDSQIRQSISQR